MIVECPRCKMIVDTGEASRQDSSCGNCESPLRDIAEEIEHNKREIEKLKWHKKPSSSSSPGDSSQSAQ